MRYYFFSRGGDFDDYSSKAEVMIQFVRVMFIRHGT